MVTALSGRYGRWVRSVQSLLKVSMRRRHTCALFTACVWISVALGDCWPASAENKWVWIAPHWDEQGIASLPKYVEVMRRVDAMRLPKNEEAKAVDSLGSTSGLSSSTLQRLRALSDRQNAEVKANKPGAWWMTTIEGFVAAEAPRRDWHQLKTFDSLAVCEGTRILAWHIVVNRLRRAEDELNVELATRPPDRWATIGDRGNQIAKDTVVRQSSCEPEILFR